MIIQVRCMNPQCTNLTAARNPIPGYCSMKCKLTMKAQETRKVAWREVPAARFMSWSKAAQLLYMARRDEIAAADCYSEHLKVFYLERARAYHEEFTILLLEGTPPNELTGDTNCKCCDTRIWAAKSRAVSIGYICDEPIECSTRCLTRLHQEQDNADVHNFVV